MTAEELRSLDYEVAVKVMGFTEAEVGLTRACDHGDISACIKARTVPEYSTGIAAAWQVFEKVDAFYRTINSLPGGRYHVTFGVGQDAEAIADTAPHAICLAALKAIEVEVARKG